MAVPDAVLGAGSALAGVLLTVIAGALRERRRLRWEDDRRWADQKRERYLDLLKASRTVTDALLDIAKAQVRLLDEWFSGQERLPGFPSSTPISSPVRRRYIAKRSRPRLMAGMSLRLSLLLQSLRAPKSTSVCLTPGVSGYMKSAISSSGSSARPKG
jgi:hypothetical protein